MKKKEKKLKIVLTFVSDDSILTKSVSDESKKADKTDKSNF